VIAADGTNELTPLSREVVRELYEELVALDERIPRADHLIKRVFADNESCQKLKLHLREEVEDEMAAVQLRPYASTPATNGIGGSALWLP
jgi:hypothetical protein